MAPAREEKHTYTRVETQLQLAKLRVIIGEFASWGDGERLIAMQKDWPHFSRKRLLNLTERLIAEHSARISAPQKIGQEFAARIRRNIDACKRASNWSAVAKFEEMLARYEGTLIAPSINLNNFNVAPALVGVMGDLPAEQVNEMLAEQAALESDARAYRTLPVAHSTAGETVEERVAVSFKPRAKR